MTGAGVALIGLGSNVAYQGRSPAEVVAAALTAVAALGREARPSRLWRSPSWPPGGPDYVNAALSLVTDTPPGALLDALHRIEACFGRERAVRWGARTLDLDLLAWGDAVRPDAATQGAWRGLSLDRQGQEAPDRLILPHPRMQDRGFVLGPLAEVAAGWLHPLTGRTVEEMLAALPPGTMEGVEPLSPA